MLKTELVRVEHQSRRYLAFVECVAEYRESAFCGMPANLMRLPRERSRLREEVLAVIIDKLKLRYAIRRLGPKLLARRAHGAEQQILFLKGVLLELLGQRLVGPLRLAKNDRTRRVFIEPLENGKVSPSSFAFGQPFVNPIGREPVGLVRVDAGGLVDHQQVVVLEENKSVHNTPALNQVASSSADRRADARAGAPRFHPHARPC